MDLHRVILVTGLSPHLATITRFFHENPRYIWLVKILFKQTFGNNILGYLCFNGFIIIMAEVVTSFQLKFEMILFYVMFLMFSVRHFT